MTQSAAVSRNRFILASAALGAVLLVCSQTAAFAWDEGFHIVAAQLIKQGRRPYLDFVFAQTPLNAYWNALVMRVFGDSWRAVHAVAALEVTAAVVLAAGFLRSRMKDGDWLAVLVLGGVNIPIVEFGPLAQAYALALLLIAGAFRLAVAAVERDRTWFAGFAGVLAGAAAGSTLLTAPVAPVLVVWIFWCSQQARVSRAVLFISGAIVSWTPIFLLLAQSPKRVLFGILQYHIFYRRSDWPGATRHDLELFASWIDSPQAIVLLAFAAGGMWFVLKSNAERRRELVLCGAIALATGLYVSTAHPTFFQYYLLTTPFLAILGAIGITALADRLRLKRPRALTAAVALLFVLGTADDLYSSREGLNWPRMEVIAAQVNAVTSPGATIYADEQTYFLTRRTPPPGNEYISSHKLRLPADFSSFVHITPQPEWDRRIAAGEFATLETCDDQDWIDQRKLTEVYRRSVKISDCAVFWDPVSPQKN